MVTTEIVGMDGMSVASIKEIRKNIIHSMEAGARGVSVALVIAPDSYQTANEIIELIKPIKE